jgi:hypothetical protein
MRNHWMGIAMITDMNLTNVTAGNASAHLSGLVLHTAAVIGIK